MKIVKKGRYILHAKWHSHHGKEVEVVMKRKGISDSYLGEMIYHVAYDPDEEYRSEDMDTEFVDFNFKPLEEMTCVIDTTMAPDDIIEKFNPYYRILRTKMLDRINVQFKEHAKGDGELVVSDYLCVFYLVDNNGKPGLTLSKDGDGEMMLVEEEEEQKEAGDEVKEKSKRSRKKSKTKQEANEHES
jgi:hypothetical protein